MSLAGCGIHSSTLDISSLIAFSPISASEPSTASKAEPETIGVSSPSNPYSFNSSHTSNSTNSTNSLSPPNWSTLFKNMTNLGTPT